MGQQLHLRCEGHKAVHAPLGLAQKVCQPAPEHCSSVVGVGVGICEHLHVLVFGVLPRNALTCWWVVLSTAVIFSVRKATKEDYTHQQWLMRVLCAASLADAQPHVGV